MGRKDGGPAKQADDVKRNDAKVGLYRRRQTELATRGRDVWENWRLEGDSDSGGGRVHPQQGGRLGWESGEKKAVG